MLAGIKHTDYVPTSLVGVNSPSPTLAAEVVTGLQIATGARPGPGEAFYLSEKWANQLSAVAINGATQLTCHAGWYMIVQLDPAANAAIVTQGRIGARVGLTSGGVPANHVVTDSNTAATNLGAGQFPVIFLNSVTPGNYTIVQISGDASVLASTAVTPVGSALSYVASTGEVGVQTASATFAELALFVGLSEVVTAAAGLVRANVQFPFGYI
jgi:hypothetical protein